MRPLNFSPIAVVGIGGLYPGAPGLDGFWRTIREAIDTAREIPPGRWAVTSESVRGGSEPTPDRVRSLRACTLDRIPLEELDGVVNGRLDLDQISRLDPSIGVALVTGIRAWKEGRVDNIDRGRVAVHLGHLVLPTDGASAIGAAILGDTIHEKIFGIGQNDWDRRPAGQSTGDPRDGLGAGLPAAALARALDLGGGTSTLDAACASSLYALAQACHDLSEGRVDAALAGGVSRPDALYTQMGFSQLHALSPVGRCHPFDARGQGLVVGEGGGIFLLKRLEDARRDGDRIRGVIRSVGLSNDRSGSLLAPEPDGQLRALQSAYDAAGWHPTEVDLIECHATGTPVGDATEFSSLRQLWGEDGWRPGQCVIGSIKANIGHLLTAAGAASLTRALLAMEHQELPPAANFESPAPRIEPQDSPFRLLDRPLPWKRRERGIPRRSAISAFGFGGINAHLLVEEGPVEAEREFPQDRFPAMTVRDRSSIAVVGIAGQVGSRCDESLFAELLGEQFPVAPNSPPRWFGVEKSDWFRRSALRAQTPRANRIGPIEIPPGRFRIPPRELIDCLPQQLLFLETARRAFLKAGLANRPDLGERSAVFVGIALDLASTRFHLRWLAEAWGRTWLTEAGLEWADEEVDLWIEQLREALGSPLTANRVMGSLGSIVASRAAREFHFGGPSHTYSSDETSGLRALERGILGLRRGEFDCALVGAVDLGGDVRSQLSRARIIDSRATGRSPFGRRGDQPSTSEGAIALILKRLEDAKRDRDEVMACIEGIGFGSGGGIEPPRPARQAWKRSIERALVDGKVASSEVGLVISGSSGDTDEDAVEAAALLKSRLGSHDRLAHFSSAAELVGHTGATASLVAVAQGLAAIQHRLLPAFPGKSSANGIGKEIARRFRRSEETEPWWINRPGEKRFALVGCGGIDGNVGHVLIKESEETETVVSLPSPLRHHWDRPALFVLEGSSDQDLLERLGQLTTRLPEADEAPIAELASQWHREFPGDRSLPSALALVANSAGALEARIEQATAALRGLHSREDAERDRREGATVFSSSTPLGHAGHVALLFPGSGNDYSGMGRELLTRFPETWRPLEVDSARLRSQLPIESIWPEGDFQPTARERILGHVTTASLAARHLLNSGLRPGAAIGYSLGETASMFGMGIWRHRDEMLHRLLESDLFTRQLAGPCRAAARHWGLSPGENARWRAGVIDRSAEVVRGALPRHPRTYLQIVNTPQECVIGGDPSAIDRLVAELNAQFYPIDGVTTVHCSVLQEVETEYRALHRFPIHAPEGIDVYSPATGQPYELSTESIAQSITDQGLRGFDYTDSIFTAYGRGARIFIETGPGSSCTRMTSAILDSRPHRALSLLRQREPIELSYARIIATLAAERVEVNREISIGDGPEADSPVANSIIVESGGEPFDLPALPDLPSRLTRARQHQTPLDLKSRRDRPPPEEGDDPRFLGWSRELSARTEAPSENFAPNAETEVTDWRSSPSHIGGESSIDSPIRFAISEATEALQAQRQALAELTARQHELISKIGRPLRSAYKKAERPVHPSDATAWLPRNRCLEFGEGSIVKALRDRRFSEIDTFPTRVRLPAEPLMLVDRILEIDGEPFSLTGGRVVTEHDVLSGAWYLDGDCAPTCIAVESGQADLFLCAWLGADIRTRGEAVYRLLDAEVTFHRDLPKIGETVRYEIEIEGFFEQGDALLFRFRFDATVDGTLVLTMRDGCAGFFTEAALAAGRGIVEPKHRPRPAPISPPGWYPPSRLGATSLDERQLEALRNGNLIEAFGSAFTRLQIEHPATIPGGQMRLLDRVPLLDPYGGDWGLGRVAGELDIHPDDWFLTCHFVDDPVMPGTLMYECCLHTLRVLLLGIGWVGESAQFEAHPVIGEPGRLRCRGQVIPTSKVVGYDVSIREIGFEADKQDSPYVIADAKMLVDGREIVEMRGLSVRFPTLSKAGIDAAWTTPTEHRASPGELQLEDQISKTTEVGSPPPQSRYAYDHASILAFALGNPSEAFGNRYEPFDQQFIARLPAPPYCFIDGILEVEGPPWELREQTRCVAEYFVPVDGWYFSATKQPRMPFAVLLETALQPCGWLAAYCGSALTSEEPLHFRNLGGKAIQHRAVTPSSGLLRTEVSLTSFSASAGMLIQHFSLSISDAAGSVYTGTTYFGFFPRPALANQLGIRDQVPAGFPVPDVAGFVEHSIPTHPRLPDQRFRMVDQIDAIDRRGGPHQLGVIRGSIAVDPQAWFFQAHFHQDPVWPGSLGLESLLQLLEVFAIDRWELDETVELQAVALSIPHEWTYRGQVLGHRERVTVEAVITEIDDSRRLIRADGRLVVDGLWIYAMRGFTIEVVPATNHDQGSDQFEARR